MRQFAALEKRIGELQRVKRALAAQQRDTSEIDREIEALRRLQREVAETSKLTNSMGNATPGLAQRIAGNAKFSQSFSQLSFAVEDFLAVYGTMGLQGALRASGNNFSMVARIISGPFMGGIIGAAVVGIPLLLKMLDSGEDKANKFADSLERLSQVLSLIERLQKDALQTEFRMQDIPGSFSNVEQGQNAIKQTNRSVKELQEDIRRLKEEAVEVGNTLFKNIFSDESSKKFEQALMDLQEWARDGVDPASFTRLRDRFREIREEFERNLQVFSDTPGVAIGIYETQLEELRKLARDMVDFDATGGAIMVGPGEVERVFGELRRKVEELKEDEKQLEELRKQGVERSDEQVAKHKEIQNLLKIRLEQEKELARVMQQQKEDALEGLIRAGQDELQQTLQRLRDAQEELHELFDASAKGPAEREALRRAEERLLGGFIKENTEALKAVAIVNKEVALIGPALQDQIHAAKLLAEEQMRAADEAREEATNDDIVVAVQEVRDALANSRLIAVPAGGGP